MSPVKNLFKLLITPQKGWHAISQENETADKLSVSLMYPILGLFALIVFLLELKFTEQRADSNIEKAIQYAAVAFIQLFSSYYLISYITKSIFKKYDTNRCNTYIIYLISITTLFYIVMTILSEYVKYITPLSLYIIYIAWSGYKYINPEADKTDTTFVLPISTMVLMTPLLISLLLRTLLTII